MTMRTPLSRVRGLGSAKQGTEHFWLQRVTAFALIPLVFFFIFSIIVLAGASYEEMRAYLGNPFVTVLIGLMVVTGVAHMRLGMQILIEDYVHTEGLKVLALMGNTFFAFVVGGLAVFSVLKLGFGG